MIIGHQRILKFFKKSIENKRLSHAYLFTGSSHLGKKTFAFEIIKMLTGEEMNMAVHPDIIILEPKEVETDKGVKKESEITIGQIREIQRQFSMFAYRSLYKIALINHAERMTSQAGNCLLKTLEEPNSKTILILITSNSELILPTIASRCQKINFLPVAEKEIKEKIESIPDLPKINKEDLNQIIRLSNGHPGLAIQYIRNQELFKKQNNLITHLENLLRSNINDRYKYAEEMSKNIIDTQKTLSYWLFWFRDLLLLSVNCHKLTIYNNIEKYNKCYSLPKLKEIIEKIKETKNILNNSSFNARLALEVLMLEF